MFALSLRPVAAALALCAAGLLFAETRHYGLLGFDTYPLIVSSRVESGADALGLLGERLMDGRYPSGFYRPVTSASFALDYALWGLEPAGYQLTGAVLFGAILLALLAVGWQLGGRKASLVAVLVPLLFGLHEAFYEIVPIPARRADLLCCALSAVAVAGALAGRRWLCAGALLLAIGAKESGFAFVPVVLLAAFVTEPSVWPSSMTQGGDERAKTALASRRWRGVAHLAPPVLAAMAFMLLVRWLVLGGLGGHREDAFSTALVHAPRVAATLIFRVALPDEGMPPTVAIALLVVGVTFAGAAGFSYLSRGVAPDFGRPPWPALGLGLGWVAAVALIYGAGGWVGAWYTMLAVAGWAIALAALLDWTLRVALRPGAAVQRGLAAISAVSLLGLAGMHASLTPFFHRYGEWGRATAVANEFLEELSARIEAGQDGRRIDAPPLPMWVPVSEGMPAIKGAAILSDYSVQAWAELVHPERRIRVLGIPDGVMSPGPDSPSSDELVVALPRRLVGY